MTDEIISTEAIESAEVVAEVKEEALTEAVDKTGEVEAVSDEKAKESDAEKNPRKDANARINQLTRQKNDAIAEAEYWKAKAGGSEGSKRDLAEHEAEKAQTKIESIDKESWAAKLDAVSEELPDFKDVVGKSKANVEPHVASVIIESDLGPKLFYHLAKNPEELEKINGMSERQAIKEIAKLELMLETKKTPEVRVSKAPEPIKPVSSQKGVVSKSPDQMSLKEYQAMRRAEGARW